MRRLFGAVLALIAVTAMIIGAPALAARTTTPFSPDERVYDNCGEGATCSAEATADGNGNQVVSSAISRSTPNTTSESSQGWAYGRLTHRLPSRTSAVRVTYRWRVDSASTAAQSTSLDGAAVGRIFARGLVSGCRGCVIEDSTDGHGHKVASTYNQMGLTTEAIIALPGAEVTHEITLRAADGGSLPRSQVTLTGATLAFSYIGERCSGGTCQPSAGHSGSASASADLQLLSITVDPV